MSLVGTLSHLSLRAGRIVPREASGHRAPPLDRCRDGVPAITLPTRQPRREV